MRYICQICGYVYDDDKEKIPFEQLPDDWKGPLCGAAKSDFKPEAPKTDVKPVNVNTEAADLKKLSAGQLAAYFTQITPAVNDATVENVAKLLQDDIDNYPNVRAVADQNKDRGAARICVWGEKVTRMLSSLVNRYLKDGEVMAKQDFPIETAKKLLDRIPNNENNKKVNIKEEKGDKTMAKWVCPVCGYIHEGETAPAECPVCHVNGEKFTKVEGELKLAAEHEFGVYAKTVKNNPDITEEDKKYIFEQLMANFTGECSEVGMYLCMARIAHREGYPEIGLYWEKAAFEEAEHAAKFAELLGSELEPNMKATTKDNLKWRVDCEFGATQGKTDLAMCAKKNGLDAIHDTVHEMARDEARHGKALKGMLERYFG